MGRSVYKSWPIGCPFASSFNLGCGGERKIAGEVQAALQVAVPRPGLFPLLSTISLPPRSSRLGSCVRRNSNSRPLAGTGALVGARLQEYKPVSFQLAPKAGWGCFRVQRSLGLRKWRTGGDVCLENRAICLLGTAAVAASDFVFICKDFGANVLETGWQLRGRSALVLLSTSPRHRGEVVTRAAPCL